MKFSKILPILTSNFLWVLHLLHESTESFDIKVQNITEFDHEGEVFGQPDQVELDIIIKNGLLIICEIKSSVSKKVNRQIVISPMVDKYAHPVTNKLGIEVYSYAEDVNMK